MTLFAYDKETDERKEWVIMPYEMANWMAQRFGGPFTRHLASLDRFADQEVDPEALETGVEELQRVLEALGPNCRSVPATVESLGPYGVDRARNNVLEVITFLRSVKLYDWKVVRKADP